MVRKIQTVFALSEKGAKDLIKAVILTVLANLSLMLPAGLLLMVLRDFITALSTGGNCLTNLASYLLMAIGLLGIMFLLHWLQYKSLYIATYTESANRRITLAEKLRQLPLSFFGERDLSDLTSTMMADCGALEQTFSHNIPQLFGATISTLFIFIGLFCLDWRLALAAFWVLPVSLMLVFGSKWLQDKFGLRNILAKRAATEGIQECLETVREIKSCNQEKRYLNTLSGKIAESEKAAIRSELLTGTFVTSAQMVLRLGLATTVLVGAILISYGRVDLMTYLIFLIATSRLYDPLSTCFINIAATFNAKLQIERMKQIEEQPVQTGTKEYTTNGYDIVFDHVTFSYQKEKEVLQDVSFVAKQGEVTALIGPSGGGKSTVTKLAARFWDITGGKITLGGVNIANIEPEALLENYSIVFQDVVLFHDTILENIRLGRRNATDEQVLAAAKAAQCDSFVQRLPAGYHTIIGENGCTLSGGERQRISIARALLKDAPVILLDEATASLDVENETEVQKAISRLVKEKTVLIIAHRMRTVAGADKVIVLQEGRVVEQGTPTELMQQNGLYCRFLQLREQAEHWSLQKNY